MNIFPRQIFHIYLEVSILTNILYNPTSLCQLKRISKKNKMFDLKGLILLYI
jgi:hypothetical protein